MPSEFLSRLSTLFEFWYNHRMYVINTSANIRIPNN